jgi:hypothetical protein
MRESGAELGADDDEMIDVSEPSLPKRKVVRSDQIDEVTNESNSEAGSLSQNNSTLLNYSGK